MKKTTTEQKNLEAVNSAYEALKPKKEFSSVELSHELQQAIVRGGRKPNNPNLITALKGLFEEKFGSGLKVTTVCRRGRGEMKKYVISSEIATSEPTPAPKVSDPIKVALHTAERILTDLNNSGRSEFVVGDYGISKFADYRTITNNLASAGVVIEHKYYVSHGRTVVRVDNPKISLALCQKRLSELYGIEPKAGKEVSVKKLSSTAPKAAVKSEHKEFHTHEKAAAALTSQERYQIYLIALDMRRRPKAISIHDVTRYAQQELLMDTNSTAVMALLKKSSLFSYNGEYVSLEASDEKILEVFDPKKSRRDFKAYLRMSLAEVQEALGPDAQVELITSPCGTDGIYFIHLNRTRRGFRNLLKLYESLRNGEKILDDVMEKQLKVTSVREQAARVNCDAILAAERSFFGE